MAPKPTSKLKLDKPRGRMPVLQFLRPAELRVDPCYQRSAAGSDSQALIRRIAQKWDWDLCQPLVVSRREGLAGDRYFVIDGQHRLEAARVRGDIDQLPCVVLSYSDVTREADSFVKLNQQRKPLTKLDLFKAAIASGDKEACAIAQAMADRGLTIAPHANPTVWKPGMVSNIAGIENAWRRKGEEPTSTALHVLSQAFAGQVLQYAGTIFPGIAAVCADQLQRDDHFDGDLLEKFVTMLAIRSQDQWRHDISHARLNEPNLNFAGASEATIRAAWEKASPGIPKAPAKATFDLRQESKPAPRTLAPPPAGATFTGYAWCDQCDRKVDSKEASACRDRFCKRKAAA